MLRRALLFVGEILSIDPRYLPKGGIVLLLVSENSARYIYFPLVLFIFFSLIIFLFLFLIIFIQLGFLKLTN